MNTLGKAITRDFFSTETGFADLERHWKTLVNSPLKKQLGAAHHLIYAAIRGKDWRKGFTEATNANKLANGHRSAAEWSLSLVRSKYCADVVLAPFAGIITKEALEALRLRLPNYWKPGADAYNVLMSTK